MRNVVGLPVCLLIVLQILWDDASRQYILPYKHLTKLGEVRTGELLNTMHINTQSRVCLCQGKEGGHVALQPCAGRLAGV